MKKETIKIKCECANCHNIQYLDFEGEIADCDNCGFYINAKEDAF